ncbi:hypothetical protein BH11MYX3_BH11MYX3_30540 [soil metagenome]
MTTKLVLVWALMSAGCETLLGIEPTTAQVAIEVTAVPVILTVGGTAQLEVEVRVDGDGRARVTLGELPAGVTGSAPLDLGDREHGTFELTATGAATHGDVVVPITAAISSDVGRTEAALRVRGRAGEIDTSFATAGALADPAQLGSLNQVAAQPDGKLIVCGADARFLQRLLPSGALDPAFATTGTLPYVGTCVDVAVLTDGTIAAIVLQSNLRYSVVPVDPDGTARALVSMPGLELDGFSVPFVKIAAIRALPEGGALVTGTVMRPKHPGYQAIAGVWLLDSALAPVTAFADGVVGVPGFAGDQDGVTTDLFGLDSARRSDGSLLVIADNPAGDTTVYLEFLAAGPVRPGSVYGELNRDMHLLVIPDDTVFLCDGATTTTSLGVIVADPHVAGSMGVTLLGTDPADRPSRCDALAFAPSRSAAFAGMHLTRWVWGKIDPALALDTSFVHEWQPPGAPRDVRRILRLPDGRWLLGGTYELAGVPHWALLRVWD